jgi:hypothetical protein
VLKRRRRAPALDVCRACCPRRRDFDGRAARALWTAEGGDE